jgi:hypothetical protein
MPYDNSEFLFGIRSTKKLIGRMKKVYRVRERRAARLKSKYVRFWETVFPRARHSR